MKGRVLISLIGICFQILTVNAQVYQSELTGENFKASFISNGSMFSADQGNLQSGYEIPKNSSKHTIYTASIWLGGIDSSTNELHISAQTYPGNFESLFPGPHRDNPFNDNSRNGIFDIEQSEVDDFLLNYGDPTYLIPSNILNWIGNGNSNSGMSPKLAPFVDLDLDGLYEPITEGEYPYILGNNNLYFVCNDISGNRIGMGSGVEPLGVEVEVYSYLLEESYDIFKDCVLQNLVIKNRSNIHYRDLYIGLWFDFDIGNPTDDYVGSDSSQNLFYGYNSGAFDSEYGQNVPAQGIVVLNRNLNSFIAYNNTSNAINGNPNTASEFYNLLQGYWNDSSPIIQSGNGTGTSGSNTKFLFERNIWDETGSGNDKRAMGSIGPFSLEPDRSICIDLAVFHAYDKINGTVQSNLNRLFLKADSLKSGYDSLINSCSSPYIISSFKNEMESALAQKPIVYPNPSSGIFHLKNINEEIIEYSLTDISSGIKIKSELISYQPEKQTFICKQLNGGVYILNVSTKENNYVFKVCITA